MFQKLKKILGGKEANETGLAERKPRAQLIPLVRVRFRIAEGSHLVSISNISTGGVGLIRQDLKEWPAPGSVLHGALVFEEHEVPVTIRVVHLSPKTVGCAFLDNTTVAPEIENYFKIEFSAMKVQEINPEILKEEPDGKPRVFRAGAHCDLFIVQKEKALSRFEMSFFGNYLEGNSAGALRWGSLDEDEASNGNPKYKGSTVVHFESPLPQGLMQLAERFLANIPQLQSEERQELVALIHKGR